jgi:thymidylate synthase (FAD)
MTTSYDPTVHTTSKGTLYLKEAGVALIAKPEFLPMEATHFINSFGDTFDAADYENDWYEDEEHRHPEADMQHYRKLDDGAELCKFAGQTCYLSFGEKRTRNKDAKTYFDNIKSSGHGSVLEHANYSFIVWGIDRACSHELVRHRAGFAYSQLSQRYVNGRTLRFVERPEYQESERLHFEFETHIDRAAEQYDMRADLLSAGLKRRDQWELWTPTERRKAVNQAARNALPNETETAVVITGNVRAWRHLLEMRASQHADLPIAGLTLRIAAILKEVSPILFDDYIEGVVGSRTDLSTQYRKV